MFLKLSLREIRNHPRFSFLFILNISLGLIGLILIENFKVSFSTLISSRSNLLLGADLSISSRKPITEKNKNLIEEWLKKYGVEKKSVLPSMFSMGTSGTKSRLVWVKAYDGKFPFYGNIKLSGGLFSPPSSLKDNEIWVYPELLRQLNIKNGAQISIGEANFFIRNTVIDDPAQTFQMGSVAPKIFMSPEGIDRAHLIQKGSTMFHNIYYLLKNPFTKSDLAKLNEAIDDHSINITTPMKAGQNVGRVMGYLTDFLGLVSLVALFLAFVGLFYLYRSYLSSKRLELAILSSMGLQRSQLLRLFSLHVTILGIAGVASGILLSALLLPLLDALINQIIPLNLEISLTVRSLVIGGLVGTLGVALLSLPLIISLLGEKATDLFQEVVDRKPAVQVKHIYFFIPLFVFYTLMAIYVSNSLRVGLIFVGAFCFLGAIFFPLGLFGLNILERKFKSKNIGFNISVKTLCRFRFSTLSIFLSLALCSTLIILIPQLESGLKDELSGPKSKKLPELFLFDIQEDQVEDLSDFFKKSQIKLLGLSPLIRSRLISINSKPFKSDTTEGLTREEQGSRRFRNRGINLSYRGELSNSEKIFKGKEFSSPIFDSEKQEIPEVSVERRYAKRMGIGLNDKLAFDVLGISIIGKVVSLRDVRWTSFMPNFFINFQPGVLNDAPKTFIATTPRLSSSEKDSILNSISSKFPNVSIVDLNRVISRLLSTLKQMSVAFKAMGLLTLMVGLMVVFSLANHQVRSRSKDVVLLKILGMDHSTLRKMLLFEFGLLSFVSTFIGSLGGVFLSFIFSYIMFDSLWRIDFVAIVTTITLLTLLCLLISYMAIRRILKEKPTLLLG